MAVAFQPALSVVVFHLLHWMQLFSSHLPCVWLFPNDLDWGWLFPWHLHSVCLFSGWLHWARVGFGLFILFCWGFLLLLLLLCCFWRLLVLKTKYCNCFSPINITMQNVQTFSSFCFYATLLKKCSYSKSPTPMLKTRVWVWMFLHYKHLETVDLGATLVRMTFSKLPMSYIDVVLLWSTAM